MCFWAPINSLVLPPKRGINYQVAARPHLKALISDIVFSSAYSYIHKQAFWGIWGPEVGTNLD